MLRQGFVLRHRCEHGPSDVGNVAAPVLEAEKLNRQNRKGEEKVPAECGHGNELAQPMSGCAGQLQPGRQVPTLYSFGQQELAFLGQCLDILQQPRLA